MKKSTLLVNAAALFFTDKVCHKASHLKTGTKGQVLSQREFGKATGLKGQDLKRTFRKYLAVAGREVTRELLKTHTLKSLRHTEKSGSVTVIFSPKSK